MIDKWLKAGVMEEGALSYPEEGTPQGGVISPLLANVYLHYVLDRWFEEVVRPCLRGWALLVRYADDFVIVCAREDDARRVMEVLPKRLGRFGLALHPDKTRLVRFERPRQMPGSGGGPRSESFDFLGFSHFWSRSRRGAWVVKRKTAKDRFRRSAKRIYQWCREHRHRKVAWQREVLERKLRGHYNYYGIIGNFKALARFRRQVERAWQRWLNRRSQKRAMPWERFQRLLEHYPLPPPRIRHRATVA